MSIAQSFLPEFDHENATTRRVLERVPLARGGWKPHAKSPTLGELAAHIAQVPVWLSASLDLDVFDGETAGKAYAQPPPPSTSRELLERFDANVAAGRAKLAAASDERMRAPWTLQKGGKTIFSMPRTAVFRSVVMGHGIHHRGQLTVYLRMLDVALPSVYGPTADEPM
jgi:uncharacterized damage-inducible protein DinB